MYLSFHRIYPNWHFQVQKSRLMKKKKSESMLALPQLKLYEVTIRANRLYFSFSSSSHLWFTFVSLSFLFFPSPSSSSLVTLTDEPQSMNRSRRVRRRHRPTGIAPRCRPCVDENKDLHILMNQTQWPFGRGLEERRGGGGGMRMQRRKAWDHSVSI